MTSVLLIRSLSRATGYCLFQFASYLPIYLNVGLLLILLFEDKNVRIVNALWTDCILGARIMMKDDSTCTVYVDCPGIMSYTWFLSNLESVIWCYFNILFVINKMIELSISERQVRFKSPNIFLRNLKVMNIASIFNVGAIEEVGLILC